MRSEFIPDIDTLTTRWTEPSSDIEWIDFPAVSWAAIIIRVDGGWQAFESVDDYDLWQNQT